MEWRIIITKKLKGDAGQQLGKQIRDSLSQCNTKTIAQYSDVYEGTADSQEIAKQLGKIIELLARHKTGLEFLSIHIDRAKSGG